MASGLVPINNQARRRNAGEAEVLGVSGTMWEKSEGAVGPKNCISYYPFAVHFLLSV